jgi:hypothetical protein
MFEQVYDRTPLWVYGHSFTQPDGVMCDPGEEWMPKLANLLDMPSWTTFGAGSSRLIDCYADISRQGYANPHPSSTWNVQRDGLIVLQAETNDIINPAMGGVAAATSLPGKALDNYQNTLMAALATLSASGIIPMTGGSPGGSWAPSGGVAYTNGSLAYSTQQGAYREFSVDVGPSGVVWLICWDVSDDVANSSVGEITVNVDGKPWIRSSARVAPWETIYSRRSGERNVGPRAVMLTDLPMGVHTLRFAKSDSGPGAVYLDRLCVIADEAPPIVVVKDPMPVGGDSWVADPIYRDIIRRNRRYLHGKIEAAASYFPNVVTASLSSVRAIHFGPDGVHPSNLGMTYEAEILERVIRGFTEQYSVDRMYA